LIITLPNVFYLSLVTSPADYGSRTTPAQNCVKLSVIVEFYCIVDLLYFCRIVAVLYC